MLGLPAALAPGLAVAQAPVAVDLMLVLAMDASGSIDEAEHRLQREGVAAALTDPGIIQLAMAGKARSIALALVEWGSPGGAVTAVDWTRVHDAASAQALADAIRAAPRSRQSYNAIGDAIVHATALIEAAPFHSEDRVIDVAGDGPDLRSIVSAPVARDRAVALDITINALAIEVSPVTRFGLPLREHYERDVIGGDDAFVMVAETRADFLRAMRAKLWREIA